MTLTQAWLRQWAAAPDAVLLCGPGGRRLTAEELAARSAAVARRLAGSAVAPGDRVLVSARTSVELAVALVGLLRLGAVVVPVNPAATTREVAHVLRTVRPVAILTDTPSRFAGREELVVTPDVPLLATDSVDLDVAPPGAAALVGFTSGTTGAPKGAVHTQASLLAGAEALVEAWEWSPDDRLVHALPLFHIHGLVVGLFSSLVAGAGVDLLGRFDVDAVADSAADASLFFGVPTMYARLVGSPRAADLTRLRLLVSGSAPLAPALFTEIERAVGQRPLERYGMTETVMLASNPLRGERRAGTVGRPLPGVELRLADGGEVQVRGPAVFAGYWEADEATRQANTHDGWFRTGDVGELDDGYLRLVGRTSELIITGGFNVYPREVEDVLRDVPGVIDVAVVGVPDAEWGQVVLAVVVGDASPVQLEEHAATELSPYKRPRRWRFVEELPRNAMGKVRRDLLADA